MNNLSFTSGSGETYSLQMTTQSNSSVFAQDWVDNWPYQLNRDFGTSVGDPLFVIKTAIGDSASAANPIISFTINRCAVVRLFFAEPPGPTEPFPNASGSLRGYTCSNPPGTNGTFVNVNNSADTIAPEQCSGVAGAGTVNLPPRRGVSGDSSRMYAVFIQTAKTAAELSRCP